MSLLPALTPARDIQLRAGHRELGEFSAHVVFSIYKMADFTFGYVTPKNLSNFCEELLQSTRLSCTVIIISLKYLQKYLDSRNAINFGVERTYLIAIILADKFHNDHRYSNQSWSEITEIPFKEINYMESTFLKCLNFQMYINGNECMDWINFLTEYIKAQQLLYFVPPRYIDSIKTDIQIISKLIIRHA
ncbi:hypothetical protein Glove_578g30 [Diversispora epigaea]|uniref:Cyclin N-terminal domain-containing protein n=1 Tax=Diversispora epigaea TaxID=1348612 RepID=A0A397GAF2_9GLOM|nr:hypothetical protein Glove_578g30 [Diversispora epigaea]